MTAVLNNYIKNYHADFLLSLAKYEKEDFDFIWEILKRNLRKNKKMLDIDKIIIIGCGGTGSMLAVPLCRYLFSINYAGEIFFCDGDKYAENNISRQNFNPNGLNINKAEYQAEYISKLLPSLAERISYIDEFLSKEDVINLIEDNTVIINCSDNLAIRKYVEDHVATLSNACHICCGNEKHSGQVQMYLRLNNANVTPSIFEQHPEFNEDNGDRSAMNCQQLAELPGGGQVICANMMSASLALNYIYLLTSGILPEPTNSGVRFSCLTNQFINYHSQEVAV